MPHVKLPCRTVYSDSAQCLHANLLLSCPALCSPMDYSHAGSSVCGILQARILEWVVISLSRGSSRPRNWTPGHLHCRQILYWLSYEGDVIMWYTFNWYEAVCQLYLCKIFLKSNKHQIKKNKKQIWGDNFTCGEGRAAGHLAPLSW